MSMELRDSLDEILYASLPVLDRAMLECVEREQQKTMFLRPGRRFEQKMEKLILEVSSGTFSKAAKEAVPDGKEKERERKQEQAEGDAGQQKQMAGKGSDKSRQGMFRRLLAAVLIMIAVLALTLTAAAAILRKIHVTVYRDEVQGADVYHFQAEGRDDGPPVAIYPEFQPEGYEETARCYREEIGILRMEWEDGQGNKICYDMYQTRGGGQAIYLDAEYDSSETVQIHGTEWFCTYRKDRYRMARLQTGDLFLLIRTPDTFPREKLIAFLAGIHPPEHDQAEVILESGQSVGS